MRRCSRIPDLWSPTRCLSANENEFSLHPLNRIIAAIMTKELKIETRRGTLLDGVLFGTGDKADTVKSSGIAASRGSDTVLICITGIHGNFYSNPFYYNIGNTLTADGIDFIYAQTNDAFGTAWSGKVNRNTQS
jgi:hypothetical protein